MLMNKVEYWLMNNPIRSAIQVWETKRMRAMTDYSGGEVLEIGCGQGEGTKLIRMFFHPKSVAAIDLDKKMIKRAQKRVKASNVKFQTASVTALPFEGGQFDAVFDFGILHHIPDWKSALNEIHGVLQKDGEFILEDLSIETFYFPVLGRLMRNTLDHPYEDMYKKKEFFDYCEEIGFKVLAKKENSFWFNLVLIKK